MSMDFPEEANPRLSATSVNFIESLIAEAGQKLRSDPVRLQELATEIGNRSSAIGYNRGINYAGFYHGCLLYLQSKFEEAFSFFRTALRAFEGAHDMGGTALTLRYLGLSHHSLCEYDRAMEYYQDELRVREQHFGSDILGVAGTKANISTLHLLMGQHDFALQNYVHILTLLKDHQESNVYIAIMSNICNVYMALNDYDLALEYQEKGLALCRKMGDEINEANTLLNMSWNHMHRNACEQALDCSSGAFSLFSKQQNIKKQAIALLYSGQTYYRMKRYEEALDFCRRSYLISYEVGDKKNCMDVFRTMGDILAETEDNELAKEYYLCALELARETKMRQMEYELCELLAQMEERTGNASRALQLYREFIRIKEEVLDERRRQSIGEMQVRFNVEQAENAKEIYRLRNIELAGALEKVELLNRDLSEANDEMNELLGMVAHDLRHPISNLSQSLFVLAGYPQAMSPQEMLSHLDVMKGTVQRMERIVFRLLDLNIFDSGAMPFEFAVFNLDEVVHAVLDQHSDSLKEKYIAMQCRIEPDLQVFADREAVLVVLGDLVSHIITYSMSGSVVEICASCAGKVVRLEIKDGATGGVPADHDTMFATLAWSPLQSGRLGLPIARRLTEAMNGRIWHEREPEKGASVIVELPAAYAGEEGENR